MRPSPSKLLIKALDLLRLERTVVYGGLVMRTCTVQDEQATIVQYSGWYQ